LPNNSDKESTAGDVYEPVMLALLADQTAAKASLEQRAITLVTTSGVLVGLLVALAALGLGKDSPVTMTHESRLLLVLSAGPFVAAAILALLANAPRGYLSFANSDIDRMVDDWDQDSTKAAAMVADLNSRRLKSASKSNKAKATLLQFAVGFEVLGISSLAAAVIIRLIISP
jgi:hypothetical protein